MLIFAQSLPPTPTDRIFGCEACVDRKKKKRIAKRTTLPESMERKQSLNQGLSNVVTDACIFCGGR